MIGRGRLLILFLLPLLVGSPSRVFALDFSAFWLYRESGGEDVDRRKEFQQSYSLGAGPSLTYQPTHAISASADVRYSRTHRDRDNGQGWETFDAITPGGQVSVVNDIFHSEVSGYYTKRNPTTGNGENDTFRAWDASLGSNWQIPLWPTVVFNFGQQFDENTNDNGVKTTDTKTTSKSVNVAWDLLLAQLYYSYSRDDSEDRIAGSESNSYSHFARVNTGGKFWDDRLTFNLGQQFQYTKSDFSIGTLNEQGFFEQFLGGTTLSSVTDPVTGPDPEDIVLSANPLLGDDNFEDPALEVEPGDQMNLGIALDLEEEIAVLHLYLDPLTPLTAEQAGSLQWDLYVRNPFDTGWDLVAENIPSVFNEEERRFELTVNLFDDDIMVVSTNQTGIELTFTELQAFSQLTEDSTTTNYNYLTSFQANARLTQTLTASTSLTFEQLESDFVTEKRKSDRLFVNGSLSWRPTPYMVPSVSYSEVRESGTDQPDRVNRSFSLTVTSFPLPTLTFVLGYTRAGQYEDNEKIQLTNNYNFLTTAQIYPDLSASMYSSYRDTESRDSEGDLVGNGSFTTRVGLNARINRALTADLTANYQSTQSDTSENSYSDSTLSLKYKPSVYLSVTGSGTKYWSGVERSDTLALNTELKVLQTNKAQLRLRHDLRKSEKTSNRVGMDFTWDISDNLFLEYKAAYVFSTSDSYRMEAFLSFRL